MLQSPLRPDKRPQTVCLLRKMATPRGIAPLKSAPFSPLPGVPSGWGRRSLPAFTAAQTPVTNTLIAIFRT